LGLAICKTLLGEFGGGLSVESEAGKGTRFVVRLPVKRSAPRPIEAAPVVKALPRGTGVRGRVLVVDDEERIRKVMVRLLKPEHEVVTVASGRDAQELLARDQGFDVILCDLMMPEMSGTDLHAWLAVHEPALARRTVFVSGGAFTAGATDYLASVANLHIEKPFDMNTMRELVSDLVAEGRSAK
ncbi:MAG: response regulator, partial [Deltaproteobacteria bacterium]